MVPPVSLFQALSPFTTNVRPNGSTADVFFIIYLVWLKENIEEFFEECFELFKIVFISR